MNTMTKRFTALAKALLLLLAVAAPLLLIQGFRREAELLRRRGEIMAGHETERRRIVGEFAQKYFSNAKHLPHAILRRNLPGGPIKGLADFPPPGEVESWGGVRRGTPTHAPEHLLRLLYDETSFPSGLARRFAGMIELLAGDGYRLSQTDFERFYHVANSFWKAEGIDNETFAFLLRKLPLETRCHFEGQMHFLGMDVPDAADGFKVNVVIDGSAYLLSPSADELAELNNLLAAFSTGTRLVMADHWQDWDRVRMTLVAEFQSQRQPMRRMVLGYLGTGFGVELVVLLTFLVLRRYESINRAQKRLLATTSHELRTPLAVIRQFAEMLLDRADQVPRRLGNYHKHIHRESMKMQFLVENLLSAARFENLKIEPAFEGIALASWLADLAETSAGLSENEVRIFCPDLDVYWDKTLMSQVITNIMENARIHAGTDLEVRVSAEGERIRLDCRDFGNSGDLPDLHKIRAFKPGGKRGLGLGLFLCNRIIANHGGKLSFAPADPGLSVGIDMPRDCRRQNR